MQNNYKDFLKYFSRTKEETKWCSGYCKKWCEDSVSHILRIADEVVNQVFIFDLPWDMERTYDPVIFKGEIIWDYMPKNDPEFIYQMNRHRYWICLGQAYSMTGDEKYTRTFVKQMKSWITNNPITNETKKTTWRTIEAGIRAENWVKAMGYFIGSENITQEVKKQFFEALICHGDYLLDCKVPFSIKSNWGILESHGLYIIGKALGSHCRAEIYCKNAIACLEKQLKTQVMDDGVHWEQSPMYHNEVLKCCLEVLRVAYIYKDDIPKIIYEKAKAMAYANLIWVKPNSCQITGGDSDETDLRDILSASAYQFKDGQLKFAAYERLDFESVWDYGKEAAKIYENLVKVEPENYIYNLKNSGHWYLRSGYKKNDDFFHFTCGSLGGGHGHFDKLHIDLSICGEDVLVDSGRYTYVNSSERYSFKSAFSHNCVVVDGKEYTNCIDSWNASPISAAINQSSCLKDNYFYVEGGHLGYIKENIYVNRKILSIGTKIYIVVDEFYGKGSHTYEQLYHFNSKGCVNIENNKIQYLGEKAKVNFYTLNSNINITKKDVTMSRHYNQKEKNEMVVVSKNGEAFNSITTVVIGQSIHMNKEYEVEKVSVIAPVTQRVLNEGEAEAIHIKSIDEEYLVVINHLETGTDCEYIGALGINGLGSVMVCDIKQNCKEMTTIKW